MLNHKLKNGKLVTGMLSNEGHWLAVCMSTETLTVVIKQAQV